MLEDKEFEDCELIGPAVIGIAGPNVTFNGNHFSGTFESVLIEAPDRPIQGVIGLRNVAFQNCRFRNVAVMGPPEVLEAFARELGR